MSHLMHPTQVCAAYGISSDTFRKLRQRFPLSSAKRTSSGPMYHPSTVASWWANLPAMVRRTVVGRRPVESRLKHFEEQRALKRLMDFATLLHKESAEQLRLRWRDGRAWLEKDGWEVVRSFRKAEHVFLNLDVLLSMARALNPANQAETAA
jgi:hypothetical protein